ncbi:MAG: serine/threonine protein kinase [Actinomycetia bacterium]|nr:serine/threonine protein kinase [Actinomycetes bacterium]
MHAERKLGGGERYEAYLGWHELLFAPVVVKVVRPDLVDDPSTRRGLAREAAILARLAHPGIVRSFDADLDGERPHLVLEHLDGPRLSSLVRRFGPLSMEQWLPLGLELCSALHYLSTESVVHLDVKPSNIIMGAPPRLIDLSIARSWGEAAELDHVTGTDAYLAPEQADPPRTGAPGAAADIFGLGVTLYEALTGERPFRDGAREKGSPPGETWPQLVEPPTPLPRQVGEAVAEPIMACLERAPAARPTAAELAGLLQPLVEALPRPVLGGLRAKFR